eukprot:280916-Pyramimonas_sp.AAC.1
MTTPKRNDLIGSLCLAPQDMLNAWPRTPAATEADRTACSLLSKFMHAGRTFGLSHADKTAPHSTASTTFSKSTMPPTAQHLRGVPLLVDDGDSG